VTDGTFDVKYVLGGTESGIMAIFVHKEDIIEEPRSRRGVKPIASETGIQVEPTTDEMTTSEEFPVGSIVFVKSRTQPGMNKPGGTGRVTAISQDGYFTVKYILGGTEKMISKEYVCRNEEECKREPKLINDETIWCSQSEPRVPKKPRVNKLHSQATNVISFKEIGCPFKKPALDLNKVIKTADPKEVARQTTFTQIVAKMFRVHQTDVFDSNALFLLINQENNENDVFSEQEYKKRIEELDSENRIMIREKDNNKNVWLI